MNTVEDTLAIFGGTPVRTEPFPTHMLGASLIGEEELKELEDVVREKSPFRHYGVGNPVKVSTLEAETEAYFSVRYALALSSGSAALLTAIAALGIGPGDEVIIPSFAWYTDYCALVSLGIAPVFADIGDDLNMDPDSVLERISSKTKAIIPVHYQGHPARMDKIMAIAKAHGLFVIEDVAQAYGGSYQGKLLGTFGDIGITSFQTHKLLTCGEGGMLLTNDETLFARAVRFHDLGNLRPAFAQKLKHKELADKKYAFAGQQLRMNELSGAFLLAQMRRLDAILAHCRGIHKRLREAVAPYKKIKVRYKEGDCGIAFIMLMPDAQTAETFSKAMVAEGIPCGPTSFCCNLVSDPLIQSRAMPAAHMAPFTGEDAPMFDAASCPNTDGYVARFVAVGIGPQYGEQETLDIIHALEKVCKALF